MAGDPDRHAHWEEVYRTKAPGEVSWFQTRPDVSLDLIAQTRLSEDATLLDVGGGASTLVDHLLSDGRHSLVVLDLSASALDHARQRLGPDARHVEWFAADVTQWRPERKVDLWHDRAVLHFLTTASDQHAYADVLRAAVKPGGWVVIAGFAPGGPLKCSGLEVVQHDAASLSALLGPAFELVTVRGETHSTPWGADQSFRYHLFRRAKAVEDAGGG
jgi:SAM-dependent methyltransferase